MNQDKPTVRSVERALDILLCFRHHQELSLTAIAKQLALHKSTVYRLLQALEQKQFVQRDPLTEKYRLGTSIWDLASAAPQEEWTDLLLPEMRKLRDTVGETISLYIKSGLERVRIQAVQSTQEIRRVVRIGERFPLFGGASSKVLLAYATPEEQEAVFRHPEWPPGWSRERLKKELQEVREQGYAYSIGEREPEAAAVAAPIFKGKEVVAALAISGPVQRFTPEKIRWFGEQVKQAAEHLSRMLQFQS
jgi:DNA-binding IclR family transcriptional regulator